MPPQYQDLSIPKFKEQLEETVAQFKQRVLPVEWQPRGVLVSEGLAFCAMADYFNVNLIIESGIWEGRSTEIWAKYFQSSVPIIAIDTEIRNDAKERLTQYPQIKLKAGDSRKILPKLVNKHRSKRIGIFIDGPKGHTAITLARRCLLHPHVTFVGIHDCHKLSKGKFNRTRQEMNNWWRVKFLTDAEWFTEQYGSLDTHDNQHDTEQDLTWEPFKLKSSDHEQTRHLGSYGPTIGFAIQNNNPAKQLLANIPGATDILGSLIK